MPNGIQILSWISFFLLGMSGWNCLNSLFMIAPYYVKFLPEKSSLATYLLISQQIGSALVFITAQVIGNRASRLYIQIIVTCTILSFISCLILMLWSRYTVNNFSLPFLAIAVLTSTIGYISTTFYLPFTSLYQGYCTDAYTIGLGFSLAFTAAMGLIQDSGSDNPRFNEKVYFAIILVSQAIASVGILWIILSKSAQTQLVSYQKESIKSSDSSSLIHLQQQQQQQQPHQRSQDGQRHSQSPDDAFYQDEPFKQPLNPSSLSTNLDYIHHNYHINNDNVISINTTNASPPKSSSETPSQTPDISQTPASILCSHQISLQNGISYQKQHYQYCQRYPQPLNPNYKREFSFLKVFWKYPTATIWQGSLAFMGFGIVVALLPFSAGSYKNGNSIYMYSISLLYIVDPFARLLHFFIDLSRRLYVNISFIISLIFGFLICLLAGLSPDHTWGRMTTNGGAIPITFAVCFGFSYALTFSSSYSNMFIIGSNATDDEMYELEIEVNVGKGDEVDQSISFDQNRQRTSFELVETKNCQGNIPPIGNNPSDFLTITTTTTSGSTIPSQNVQPVSISNNDHQESDQDKSPSTTDTFSSLDQHQPRQTPSITQSPQQQQQQQHRWQNIVHDEDLKDGGDIESSATPTTFLSSQQTPKTIISKGDQSTTVSPAASLTSSLAPASCPLCALTSKRHDDLRQVLFRVNGCALQLGSLIGTMIGATLTVFTSTIPEPVVPTMFHQIPI